MGEQPHSAEQFGEQRDFWWNKDFLDLMAKRWRLGEASSLADIGCGRCHWSRLLYPYLRPPARLAAIDREPRWVAEGEQEFRRAFPKIPRDLASFAQGDATAIPLPDNSVDVATCQTVLMHLPQPLNALREMVRILKPGGLLVCVEPNNLWNYLTFTSVSVSEPTERMAREFEFWLRYHRGKIALGKGDHAIGDLLPGYFAEVGLRDIAVHLSDRTATLFPPYDTPGQKATIEQAKQWKESATGPWDREELRASVLAGGGSEEFFERGFKELVENFRNEQVAIAAHKFHAGYGGVNYLVSGRKP